MISSFMNRRNNQYLERLNRDVKIALSQLNPCERTFAVRIHLFNEKNVDEKSVDEE